MSGKKHETVTDDGIAFRHKSQPLLFTKHDHSWVLETSDMFHMIKILKNKNESYN